jgi:hypothetical protein
MHSSPAFLLSLLSLFLLTFSFISVLTCLLCNVFELHFRTHTPRGSRTRRHSCCSTSWQRFTMRPFQTMSDDDHLFELELEIALLFVHFIHYKPDIHSLPQSQLPISARSELQDSLFMLTEVRD